ncbi:hypothetical protein GWK08_05945 [Leptobacterium flavescens]|uniref:Prepilin-type N-terminal cleavage/methylation domain-containing protein n=1 Tax=Leptobacterium flavescens TaxID=472055 RepID=A0A6P0UK97_9FLAO|nr:hypothetical protein [Leptobacterium flavescens]NER12972.1 hypothetical protein [Leptobacterium flavescens]
MKKNGKIKAFTLNEMVVVLILTAIVVGLAFSVLRLTQKQMNGIQQNFIASDEVRKLEQSLWIDFNRYSRVHYDPQEEKLQLQNELGSVAYDFEEGSIIREQDTLHIKREEMIFYLHGKETVQGAVDAIEIITSKEFLNKTIFVYKQNDATHYMNNGL